MMKLMLEVSHTQQALDNAMEALKDIKAYALDNEANIARAQSAA